MNSFISDFSTGFTKVEANSVAKKMQEVQTSTRLFNPELAAVEGIVELKYRIERSTKREIK